MSRARGATARGLIPPAAWRTPVAPPPLTSIAPRARRLIARLETPEQLQGWLHRLPYNWEHGGETARTLPEVLRHGRAHCLEAALAAATILEHHGYPPLLMDLESKDQLDHVLFLFRRRGRFGTVARSRDPGLHGRKPVFPSLRALVASYAATYIDLTGCLRGYGVLDLRRVTRVDWRASKRNVRAIEQELIRHRHERFHVAPAYYRRWHERYVEYKRRFPDRKPVYYPNRHQWL